MLRWLIGQQILHAYVVTRPEQAAEYSVLVEELGLGVDVLPIGEPGIANTRNAILEHAGENKLCMVDDDLEFLIRRDDHAWRLRGATYEEIKSMFQEIDEFLSMYTHVAVSMREGNNWVTDDNKLIGRGIRLVAYNGVALSKLGVEFRPEVEGREDLDITLQLLRAGHPNLILHNYAQGQRGSNTTGGLSGTEARQEEEMKRTAEKLAELHPNFVKAVQKTTKTAWGGQPRWDVNIQWKKAFESAEGVKVS